MSAELEQVVKVKEDQQGLPRELGNGLTLRWSTKEDVEKLVQFLGNIFTNGAGQPDQNLIYDIYDWLSGQNPKMGPTDFTLVVDENRQGKIVSALMLISHEWAYDGIPFKVGEIGAVATDPAYRRKGLVRQQFEVVHARSASRGDLVQVIAGIPWYYRQFGYEMAIQLQGNRKFYWNNATRLDKDQTETYQLHPATVADIELLKQLYAIHCQASLITHVRSDNEWRYELTIGHPEGEGRRHFYMIETTSGNPAGYAEISHSKGTLELRELAVLPGHPLRMVCEFLSRRLKPMADERALTNHKPDFASLLNVVLGTDHPGYTAFGRQLWAQNLPYGWYVRITDIARFLQHITPALNKHLAGSIFDGYSGAIELNLFRSHLRLVLEQGKVTKVETYASDSLEDGDANFPDLTFLQLLMGLHNMDELESSYPDCYAKNPRTTILLNTLFPKKSSSLGTAI